MTSKDGPRIAMLVTVLSIATAATAFVWMQDDGRDSASSGTTTTQRGGGNVVAKVAREAPYGIEERTPWTTSRVTGSPDPPPPYRTQRVFKKLHFKNPTLITNAPGTDRLFVGEQSGKIYSFPNDPSCERADRFLDLSELVAQEISKSENSPVRGFEALYGMTFHPDFVRNRYCYVCYVVNGKNRGQQLAGGTRVSRFKVTDSDPPRCDPKSEQIVIAWLQGGHNGGCLKFGADGRLYISTGDGGFAFPPDGRSSGQDLSTLLSCILRIDVDKSAAGSAYAIPQDNPFVDLSGARGEIWAYGLRNPWKMSFDRANGDLWVGDVGWELWELVQRVQRGGNYGWSITEGRQPVHNERKPGPTPILPPTIEIPHTDGASVTGGFVYRGRKLPELVGTYIFGDWETRRIWGVRYNPRTNTITQKHDLVEPTIRLVAFAEDNDGELYLLDYDDGTIHQFFKHDSQDRNQVFPKKLSETGLFASTADHIPAEGVVPFSINAEQWSDTATADRLIGLPESFSIVVHKKPASVPGSMFSQTLEFPKDSVLVKTLSLEKERGDSASRRRIETQLLHFDGKFWRGYSYQWNDEQTDAALVESVGLDHTFSVKDVRAPGGKREQLWHISSRVECARCHNPWAEYTLAFNLRQLNKTHDYGDVTDNQLRTLEHIGILGFSDEKTDGKESGGDSSEKTTEPSLPRLINPYDETADLNKRARSYLHVNCAHCHRSGGGGTAYIRLPYEIPIGQTKTLVARPAQGAFGIHDAHILSPGDPYRSVLFYRMWKLGPGRMPHIGSTVVDEAGLKLMHDWIRQLPVRTDVVAVIEQLRSLDEPTALAEEAKQAEATLERLALQAARKRVVKRVDEQTGEGRSGPNDHPKKPEIIAADREQAKIMAEEQAAGRVTARMNGRVKAIGQLLSRTENALLLARTVERDSLPLAVRQQVIAAAAARPEAHIRDVFERFLPDEKRVKRLGSVIRPALLLALNGDARKGKTFFFKNTSVQCKNCHAIAGTGGKLGPELTHIGKKSDRAQLLESILEPSKTIDPKFIAYLVETTKGRVHTGLLVEKTDREVVLKDARNQEIRIPADEIEQMFPQRKSFMPELLLRDMTAQQVADLLAYLDSLE